VDSGRIIPVESHDTEAGVVRPSTSGCRNGAAVTSTMVGVIAAAYG